MAEQQTSGETPPTQGADPRRTANPPIVKPKQTGPQTETPKSSPDAAVTPDKLNAQNDK